jgi:hypothetical protein
VLLSAVKNALTGLAKPGISTALTELAVVLMRKTESESSANASRYCPLGLSAMYRTEGTLKFAVIAKEATSMTSTAPGRKPAMGMFRTGAYTLLASGEKSAICAKSGRVTLPLTASVALSTKSSTFPLWS